MIGQRVLKPHFVYRPQQLARRVSLLVGGEKGRRVERLPWGLDIEFDPTEEVGSAIARTGVHELSVTEVMFRVVDPGDRCVDIGGNIGYMTGVLAVAAGPTGSVDVFEPMPDLNGELAANIDRWRANGLTTPITLHREAVSATTGTATLSLGDDFDANRGIATLEAGAGGRTVDVPTLALDEFFTDDAPIQHLKIDVEGHEADALRGMEKTLAAKRVRDIVFEENEVLPTPVTEILLGHGYTLFGIVERLRGARLVDANDPEARPRWNAPTYLATLEPERALLRTSSAQGWESLRTRSAPVV